MRARRTCARPSGRCTSATATRRCATRGRRASSRARRSGGLARLALPPLLASLRRQDLRGAAGPDVFVANSQHVADRIARYYGRAAEVVNPPVDVEHYLSIEREPADYYLAFGRVVPYKRVDLAVEACARSGRALKVAGDGRALRGAARPGRRRRGAARQGLRARARRLLAAGARTALPGRGGLRHRAGGGAGGGGPRDRLRRRRRVRDGARRDDRRPVRRADRGWARRGDRALRGARARPAATRARTRGASGASASARRWRG